MQVVDGQHELLKAEVSLRMVKAHMGMVFPCYSYFLYLDTVGFKEGIISEYYQRMSIYESNPVYFCLTPTRMCSGFYFGATLYEIEDSIHIQNN